MKRVQTKNGPRLSAKEIIVRLLHTNADRWFWGYELEKVGTPYGWIGTQGQRRARELAEDGRLDRRIKDGLVQYRISKPQTQLDLKETKPWGRTAGY